MSEEDKVPSPDGVGVVPEPEPETVRRRPKWLAPVAAGCVLVLLAVGGVAGYRVWSARELASARTACCRGGGRGAWRGERLQCGRSTGRPPTPRRSPSTR